MPYLFRTKNCGIAEINGLGIFATPLKALRAFAPELKHGITWPPGGSRVTQTVPDGRKADSVGVLFPFVTFTGVVPDKDNAKAPNYGQTFADFITENNLGDVVTMPAKLNWTGNTIQHWLWRPDYDALFALLDTPEPVEASNAEGNN